MYLLGDVVAHSVKHRICDQYVTGSTLSRVPPRSYNLGQVIYAPLSPRSIIWYTSLAAGE